MRSPTFFLLLIVPLLLVPFIQAQQLKCYGCNNPPDDCSNIGNNTRIRPCLTNEVCGVAFNTITSEIVARGCIQSSALPKGRSCSTTGGACICHESLCNGVQYCGKCPNRNCLDPGESGQYIKVPCDGRYMHVCQAAATYYPDPVGDPLLAVEMGNCSRVSDLEDIDELSSCLPDAGWIKGSRTSGTGAKCYCPAGEGGCEEAYKIKPIRCYQCQDCPEEMNSNEKECWYFHCKIEQKPDPKKTNRTVVNRLCALDRKDGLPSCDGNWKPGAGSTECLCDTDKCNGLAVPGYGGRPTTPPPSSVGIMSSGLVIPIFGLLHFLSFIWKDYLTRDCL